MFTLKINFLIFSFVAEKVTFDVFFSQDYQTRVNKLVIDASLKLSFMGGLISVDGSANYLHDESQTDNQVQVTLLYSVKTKTERIPYGTIPDNDDLCNKYGDEPTHYVNEITYGLNAYMQFTTTLKYDMYHTSDSITHSLLIFKDFIA